MAGTGAQFSQTQNRPGNPGCPPVRRGRGSGLDTNVARHFRKCFARETFRIAEPRVPSTQVNGSRENTISCLLYVFRWRPGKNSALLANLHRPDVCLPASGWTQVADDGVRNYPVTGAFELPFRHFEFQRAFGDSAPQTAHAFYCLSEDRASGSPAASQGTNSPSMSGSRSEWTRAERLRSVMEGRRHLGQQVIEVIFISSEPFSAADAESHLRDLVRDVMRPKVGAITIAEVGSASRPERARSLARVLIEACENTR